MSPNCARRAAGLRLHGLLAHWSEVMADAQAAQRVAQWLGWEMTVRAQRSLERRVRAAHIGQFKPLADFDWNCPDGHPNSPTHGHLKLLHLN